MKMGYTIAVSSLAGLAIGAAAVQVLHAQAKPPVYAIALNQLADPEGHAKDYLPKGRARSSHMEVSTLPQTKALLLRATFPMIVSPS